MIGWHHRLKTWVWVNSGSWWWTVKPGMLQFMVSQRVRLDRMNELNWPVAFYKIISIYFPFPPVRICSILSYIIKMFILEIKKIHFPSNFFFFKILSATWLGCWLVLLREKKKKTTLVKKWLNVPGSNTLEICIISPTLKKFWVHCFCLFIFWNFFNGLFVQRLKGNLRGQLFK